MKKLLSFIFGLLIAIMLMVNQSCTKDYLIPVEIIIPDTVSFSIDILPIFTESCAKSGCHNTGDHSPDLTAANAYYELWAFGFIDTTDDRASVLFTRMDATSSTMPPLGRLPEDKIQLVLAWIEQGALDN